MSELASLLMAGDRLATPDRRGSAFRPSYAPHYDDDYTGEYLPPRPPGTYAQSTLPRHVPMLDERGFDIKPRMSEDEGLTIIPHMLSVSTTQPSKSWPDRVWGLGQELMYGAMGMPTIGSASQYFPAIRPFMTRSPGGYLTGPGPIGSEAGRAAMRDADLKAIERLKQRAGERP